MRLFSPALAPQAPHAGDALLLALLTLFLRAAWEVWKERLTLPITLTLRTEAVPARDDVKQGEQAIKYVLEIGEK